MVGKTGDNAGGERVAAKEEVVAKRQEHVYSRLFGQPTEQHGKPRLGLLRVHCVELLELIDDEKRRKGF